jgi:hypothetical protein
MKTAPVLPHGGRIPIQVFVMRGGVGDKRSFSQEPTVQYGLEAGQPAPLFSAIFVGSNPHPPSVVQSGILENFSETLAILDNDFDGRGTSDAQTLRVVMFAVGTSPDKEVEIYVSGNNIRNVTEPAINFLYVGGRAHVERNLLTTGSMTRAAGADVIRAAGSRSYLIARNSVDCGWADPAAVGLHDFPQPSPFAPEAKRDRLRTTMSPWPRRRAPPSRRVVRQCKSGAPLEITPC